MKPFKFDRKRQIKAARKMATTAREVLYALATLSDEGSSPDELLKAINCIEMHTDGAFNLCLGKVLDIFSESEEGTTLGD